MPAVAEAVVRLGGPRTKAIESLIQDLVNRDYDARSLAANSLGRIGPPAIESAPALRALLASDDVWLEGPAVATALYRITGADEPAVGRSDTPAGVEPTSTGLQPVAVPSGSSVFVAA